MHSATKFCPEYITAIPAAITPPSRFWCLAIVAVSAASWAAIFGAAKLLLASI
jgi:hypothetical protein